jgi:hypothetical protein
MTDSTSARSRESEAGAGEEVDSFDRDLEEKIHKYIASATPTDGPAPAG